MLRETLEDLHRSPSAEKHLRIVLAMEAREGLNTRDKVESLPVATGHLFEGTMGIYHPPGIADYPTPSGLSDSSGGNM